MVSINSVALLGSLKGEVRVNQTANSQVANFTIITESLSINKKTFTTYHNCTAWGNMVDIIKETNEGDIVGVQGELRSESWEQNGEKRYKTVVVCNRINVETDEVF